ncbi:MAG: hypothetical protein ABI969_20460, partial [bacterium]
MHPITVRSARQVGLAVLLAASTAVSAAALPTRPSSLRAVADVTEIDVAASNKKVGDAYSALVAMWSADFKQLGANFTAPSIV